MTWIRIDCDLPDHPVIGLLAQALKVDTDRSLACYTRTLLGFGDHRPDGRPAFVADVTLEEWAKWKGKPGQWAEAFRRLCIEQRLGQKDDPGVIKGWWRQRALLEKQLKDAARRKPRAPKEPGENPRGFSGEGGGNDDDDVYGTESSSASGARAEKNGGGKDEAYQAVPTTLEDYVNRCTVACNRGLRENLAIGSRFNELVASNQVLPRTWFEARIPIEVAEQAIYERSKEYPPAGTNRQPRNLNYFRDIVPEAWERARGRYQERRFQPRTPRPPSAFHEEEDEFVRAGRELDKERAREKARGHG